MRKIKEVIVVEGRYDKNTLSQIVDAAVIETNGFGIFNDREKMALLRRLAETRGLIVLTDSDGAGFVIRNRIRGSIDPRYVKHAYIPDIPGKERRKKVGSREGTLGVEGMTPAVILEALRRAGATETESDALPREPITKSDMAAAQLSGTADAARNRARLQKELSLPAKLSPNALLEVLNVLMDRREFLSTARALLEQDAADRAEQDDQPDGSV